MGITNTRFAFTAEFWAESCNLPVEDILGIKFAMGYVIGYFYDKSCKFSNDNVPELP